MSLGFFKYIVVAEFFGHILQNRIVLSRPEIGLHPKQEKL